MKVKNITDQLIGFTDEVADAVEHIQDKQFTREEALEIVKLGIYSMFVEVLHHKLGNLQISDLNIFAEIESGRGGADT